MSNTFESIAEHKNHSFETEEFNFELLSRFKNSIEDSFYFDFIIENQNGGFYFEQSLHFYGYTNRFNFHNIQEVNNIIQEEYQDIVQNLIFFSQDIFGNQFSFDTIKKEIIFFNIETGERQTIARSFKEWINVILHELEYFTGINITTSWMSANTLHFNERLVPKIPFVVGGKYDLSNLYSSTFPNYIRTNANIARQVFNLPDGTSAEIK